MWGVCFVYFSSKGSGDLSIRAECMNLQEIYSIQDCTLYSSNATKCTGTYSTGSDSNYSYITSLQTNVTVPVTFPSSFEISMMYKKANNTGNGGLWYLGASTSTCLLVGCNSGGTSDSTVPIVIYDRINGSHTLKQSNNCFPNNQWVELKITYQNNLVTVSANGQSISYSYTMPSSIIMQNFQNTALKISQLKIKPL